MNDMTQESAEALFSAGFWRWQDDEIVWHEDTAESNIDKDVSGD